MTHKILLFASGYKYSGSANGICARNLVREYIRQGHDVFVIAVPHAGEKEMEVIDGAKVWFVKNEWLTRALGFLQKHRTNSLWKLFHMLFSAFRAILLAPLYPNTTRLRMNSMLRLSHQIIQKYDIDTVIGTCLPYDGITTAVALKKQFGDRLRVVTYHFDILSTPNNKLGIVYSYKEKLFAKAFAKEQNIVDKVFLPETAKGLHKNSTNIQYIGLPVYLSDNTYSEKGVFIFSNNVYNITYIGSLDIRNRSILPALRLITKLNADTKKKYILHVWGNLTDADTKKMIDDNTDIVQYHGLLDNDSVKPVLEASDFLLNISNLLLYRLLPSKIFTMFSTGKPIINIVNHPNDCSLPFFEKYGNVINIKASDIDSINISPLSLFEKKVNAEKLFEMYKPAVIAKELLAYD